MKQIPKLSYSQVGSLDQFTSSSAVSEAKNEFYQSMKKFNGTDKSGKSWLF